MIVFEDITNKSKVSLGLSILIMITFFLVQTCVVFGWCENTPTLAWFGYSCFIAFTIPFGIVVSEFLKNKTSIVKELRQKNTYLEHAAKIIRHDMHSGINTYLPRGLKSLERRLTPEQIKILKIESPIKMLKEGLKHTQKVYSGVYEFTNLVKNGSEMTKEECDVRGVLIDYLSLTSYKSQIIIEDSLSFNLDINESLFCTALDNLIRNGLRYNDSPTKWVKIYREGKYIIIEDNGRGMSQEDYDEFSKPYIRKEGQEETGSGLGLNICNSIMEEHRFRISVDKLRGGAGEFYKDLSKIEELYNKNTDRYAFDRETLEKVAIEDNFRGKIKTRRGGRDRNKVYVIYDENIKSNKGTKIKIKVKR
jgi:hypothetical protein